MTDYIIADTHFLCMLNNALCIFYLLMSKQNIRHLRPGGEGWVRRIRTDVALSAL